MATTTSTINESRTVRTNPNRTTYWAIGIAIVLALAVLFATTRTVRNEAPVAPTTTTETTTTYQNNAVSEGGVAEPSMGTQEGMRAADETGTVNSAPATQEPAVVEPGTANP